jgi:hypothetical protein
MVLRASYDDGQCDVKEKGELTYPVKLVGNVAKHDGGANIAAVEDALTADAVVLVCRVAVVWLHRRHRGTKSRTEADDATLVVHARLDATWGVDGAFAGVQGRLGSEPLKGLLQGVHG